MSITLNNPMGGETEGFLEQYEWTDDGGTTHVVTYTPDQAGGSGPGVGGEGWTVGSTPWQAGEPEIFFATDPFGGGTWNAYNPDAGTGYMFTQFEDGTGGGGGPAF
ncbi:MAG: hypothetical protein ACLFWL_09055 [Candidatus Brocadiia bacterium]